MIVPKLQGPLLLKSIEQASSTRGELHVWWLGQSGYLVKWNGHHILIDPYLSDSLTLKYQDTDKPHIRMTELVVEPHYLDFIDLVTSSHNHTDHLDGGTLKPLLKVNKDLKVVVPIPNISFAAKRLDVPEERLIGIGDGQKLQLMEDVVISAIPAAHNEITRDESGHTTCVGYIFQIGSFTIYHSGDTLLYDGIQEALEPFNIDLALLPINGNRPERRVAGNLNAREAVMLAKQVGAKMLVPCHYHMFTFNTVDPDEFIELATQQNQPFKVLEGGEQLTLKI